MSETFVVDLTNYKDRMGERIAPGRYTVRVDDAEMDTSRAGNQMINLWLTVQSGEAAGATIIDRLTLTENAMFRVVGFMQALGMPTPKKRLQLNLRQFIGKVLDVDVEDGEPYNGRVKSEVRGYMKPTKAAASEDLMEPEDLTEDESSEVDLDTVEL